MYINYRELNIDSIVNTHPVLLIDDILDILGGSVIFSKIYLAQGYYHVWIAKGHDCKTAF